MAQPRHDDRNFASSYASHMRCQHDRTAPCRTSWVMASSATAKRSDERNADVVVDRRYLAGKRGHNPGHVVAQHNLPRFLPPRRWGQADTGSVGIAHDATRAP